MNGEGAIGAGAFIDELHKLRLLDPRVHENAENLRDQSSQFSKSSKEFEKTAREILDTLNAYALAIADEKKQAIGLRNLVEMHSDRGARDENDLRATLRDKELRLQRLKTEIASLERVDNEQNKLIEKIRNNDF